MSCVCAWPCNLACLRENLRCGHWRRHKNMRTVAWILTAAVWSLSLRRPSIAWYKSSLWVYSRQNVLLNFRRSFVEI